MRVVVFIGVKRLKSEPSAAHLRSFRKTIVFDTHQSGRISRDDCHPNLDHRPSMSLILDVCGASTDEAVDQAFNEGTAIPAGISNFDLSDILVLVQDGSIQDRLDHRRGGQFRDRFEGIWNAHRCDAFVVELLSDCRIIHPQIPG